MAKYLVQKYVGNWDSAPTTVAAFDDRLIAVNFSLTLPELDEKAYIGGYREKLLYAVIESFSN